MWNRSYRIVNLGQILFPPPLSPMAPSGNQPASPTETKVIEFEPRPPEPTPRPETTETMPPEALAKLRELGPGAEKALNDICFFLYLYGKELSNKVKNFKEMKDAADAANRFLDQNKKIEGNLWEFLFRYCDAPRDAVEAIFKTRIPNLEWWKPGTPLPPPPPFPPVATPRGGKPPVYPPVATPPVRPPIATPTISPRPTTVPTRPQPIPIDNLPTPSAYKPQATLTTPTMSPYMNVATEESPQYGLELQRQLESLRQKEQEFYGRPSTPTPGQYGGGIPVPGTQRAPVSSTMCPPGQFWDGRQCRGSIAPGATGLISAAAGAGGVTAMGPGGISTTSGVTSVMSGPYPIMNL